jgi:NTE family protein
MRALSLPGCACRGAFQVGVLARLHAAGERFDLVAGASSGSICGAIAVAGRAAQGPDLARELSGAPIVSTRYLGTERSIFGIGHILREALKKHLPEPLICDAEAELLVATTHAGHYVRRFIPAHIFRRGGAEEARHDPLVVHSSRARRDMHDVLVASCYIPVVHAGVTRLDGALHVDGALADNTLLDALVAKGATEITVITPFPRGAVARTMFAAEGPLHPRPGVRLRVLYPERPLSIGRFDLDRGRIEEALAMPHRELIVEDPVAARRAPA